MTTRGILLRLRRARGGVSRRLQQRDRHSSAIIPIAPSLEERPDRERHRRDRSTPRRGSEATYIQDTHILARRADGGSFGGDLYIQFICRFYISLLARRAEIAIAASLPPACGAATLLASSSRGRWIGTPSASACAAR